jgi:hypothetical protein
MTLTCERPVGDESGPGQFDTSAAVRRSTGRPFKWVLWRRSDARC